MHALRLTKVGLVALGLTMTAWGCAYGIVESDDVEEGGALLPICDCPDPGPCPSTLSSTTSGTGAGGSGAGGEDAGTGGEDAGTGGSSSCDNRGDCYECANCSLNYDCAAEANACMNSVDCTDLMDCLYACGDDACMNACANQYPTGMNLYMQMTTCAFCDACPIDCQVEGQGLCY
jgi:hypothetical protein